jgi:hypothetical protein
MNRRVLAAGWPFAGLLALDAGRAGVSGTARVCGLVVENDEEGGILVLEPCDGTGRVATGAATGFYGVDDYPIAGGDIHAGDTVEAVQEKTGAGWGTTTVRVLRRAPRPGRST